MPALGHVLKTKYLPKIYYRKKTRKTSTFARPLVPRNPKERTLIKERERSFDMWTTLELIYLKLL